MPARVTVEFKDKQKMIARIREFKTRGEVWLVERVLFGALSFKKFAKEGCPVATGRLKDSIGNPIEDGVFDISRKGLSIKVGTKVPYAMIVDKGIETAYAIRAKYKRALRWTDKSGKVHFATEVLHPPFRGKFFMENAAVRTREIMQRIPYGKIA